MPEPNSQDAEIINHSTTTYELCDLEQVIPPLCASVFSFKLEEIIVPPHHIVVRVT